MLKVYRLYCVVIEQHIVINKIFNERRRIFMSKKNLKRSLALSALMTMVITGNVWAATFDGETLSGSGATVAKEAIYGAVYSTQAGYGNTQLVESSNTISNSTFTGFSSEATGSNSYAFGGVIFNNGLDLTVDNCTFTENEIIGTSRAYGGAIAHQGGGNLVVKNSTFDGNKTVKSGGSDGSGSAIYVSGASAEITGNTFENHSGGRVIFITGESGDEGKVTLEGNEFIKNARGAVNIEANGELEFKGENTFKDNGSNSLKAKGDITFTDGSNTTFDNNNNDIELCGDTVVTLENGSTVNIGSGITSEGVNGKIVLDGGTLNLDPDADKGVDIANLEVTNDSTIGIGENILSGASNFTVGNFTNDDGNNGKNQVDVKATGVDLSGGAANALAGLKDKMQTVMANAGITADSNFNFITNAIGKSALYGDLAYDEATGEVTTTMDTTNLVIEGDVAAATFNGVDISKAQYIAFAEEINGKKVTGFTGTVRADGFTSMGDVYAFDGKGKFNSLNETAAGVEANKQAIANVYTKDEIDEYRAKTEQEVNDKFGKVDQAIEDNKAAIDENKVAIENNDKAIKENRNDIEANREAIKDVQDVANKNAADIAVNKEAIKDLQDATNKNTADIAANKAGIEANKQAIADEVAAREAADKALSDAIDNVAGDIAGTKAQVEENKVAIADNAQAIENEVAAREAADKKLQASVDKESVDRQIADAQERAERAQADQELQANIDAEAQARRDADAKEAQIRSNEDQRIESKFDGEVGRLDNRIDKVDAKIDKVGAMAAAMASLKTMGYDSEAPTEIAVGVGQYRNETGLAIGAFHYPNKNFMLNFSLSTAGDEVMGGVGATWKIGRKKPAGETMEDKVAKAEEMKKAAKAARVKAQQARHAKMLAEKSK